MSEAPGRRLIAEIDSLDQELRMAGLPLEDDCVGARADRARRRSPGRRVAPESADRPVSAGSWVRVSKAIRRHSIVAARSDARTGWITTWASALVAPPSTCLKPDGCSACRHRLGRLCSIRTLRADGAGRRRRPICRAHPSRPPQPTRRSRGRTRTASRSQPPSAPRRIARPTYGYRLRQNPAPPTLTMTSS